MGIMNTTQVMGQLVANFLASAVASIFNTTAGMGASGCTASFDAVHNLPFRAAVGGMFAAIGAVLVWTLILPEKPMVHAMHSRCVGHSQVNLPRSCLSM